MTMKKLEGKTALITGGNSGIGLAAAKCFIDNGARVAIIGRDPQTLQEAKLALGDNLLAIQGDVGQVSSIERAVAEVQSLWGNLDIVFANAAIAEPAPFEAVTEERFDAISAVNFKGVFFTVQKALPLLNPGASVIVTTSISNQVGAPAFSVYAACKAGLRSLVQSMSLELIGRGIRVNAVSPGPVDTPGFGRWGLPQEMVDAARAEFERRSPVKRFATSEEIAKAVLFLASDDSSYCVGTELVVDGGFSALM